MMLRSPAEHLFRDRKIKRRLPNAVTIYVSPDSQLKYLRQKFDVDLAAMADRFVTELSCVWDIGANCGTMAFSAAREKQIVAVEADPFLVGLLQKSVALNGVPVKILAAAAFSHASLAEFSIARRGRASNYLTSVGGRSQTGGERGRILVPTLPLDLLLDTFDPPTFIKIDVEGAEVEVLKGAFRILREIRPVYYEAGTKTSDQCLADLASANYGVTQGSDMNWLAEPR